MGRTTEGGRNIFEAAATFGFRGVKYFVEKKHVPVISTNVDNRTAAHLAAREDKLDVVKYLLGKNSSLIDAVDNYGYTMYHLATINGALKVVTYLLDEHNVDLYQPNKVYNGNTPVHLAAESGHLKILRYFIENKKADVNVLNDLGQPPVFLAAEKRRTRIVNYVAETLHNLDGFKMIDKNNRSILFMSAKVGDCSIPKILFSKYKFDLDVDQQDDTGATVTFWGSKLGYFDFIKYIVSWRHANVNLANKEGRTPLHEAVGEGHVYISKYLIEHGANKTALDHNGMSPRMLASDQESLSNFKKTFKMANKIRAERSVPQHALHFVQLTTTQSYEQMQSVGLRSTDQSLGDNFGKSSGVGDVLTLISGLADYFGGHRGTVFESLSSPKTIVRNKIDMLAVNAVNAADLDF